VRGRGAAVGARGRGARAGAPPPKEAVRQVAALPGLYVVRHFATRGVLDV
jgi:hypothetical protein